MPVTIIKGSIGSGKTKYCLKEMREAHNAHPHNRYIMLVPSHYSHITEQMLIDEFGGTGLNNIHATSLEKLSRELVINPKPHIGVSGRYALIYHAIKLYLKDTDTTQFDGRFLRAIKKTGFVDVCASLLSELNRYNITPHALLAIREKTEDKHLAQKLEVLSGIAQKYRELVLASDFSDSEDSLSELAGVIGKAFTSEDTIWIDKFDEFLPTQLEVIKELIKTGAKITITMSVCPNYEDTYYGTKKAIRDICDFCSADIMSLEGGMEHITSPDLKFLFSNWHNGLQYDGATENIQIFTARDSYTEIEHIASTILDLVRDEGYRYRDIGIISPDADMYSHILSAIFNEYNIPYYGDETIAISEYPIVMQILSLFNIVETNWDYEAMFSYLRSGFIYSKSFTPEHKVKYVRLNPDHIDLLENHVLRFGINRKYAWQKEWTNSDNNILGTAFNEDQEDKDNSLEWLDKMRQKVTAPITAYCQKVQSGKTVSDYCRALYEFLEETNLYEGLKTELLSTAINIATAESQRLGQVWNLLLEVLDEIESVLGSTEVSHSDFAELMRVALTQCKIRTIPSGIDRVFVGSADMNRALPTKVIFAMGAVSGTYPTVSTREGYFSNAEREALEDKELHLAPTTYKKAQKLRNTVYKLLSAVTNRLYISYPSMTSDSKSCLPSQTILDIIEKLPKTPQYDDIVSDGGIFNISSPRATLHTLIATPDNHPLKAHVWDWFNKNEQWRDRIIAIERSRKNYNYHKPELLAELAEELYRHRTRYSATRLKTYAQCPFSHYLKYGLGAKEQDRYELDARDTGTYAHGIIERLCKRIDSDPELDWKAISNEKCDSIVTEIVEDTIKNVTESDLRDKEYTIDILRRMGDTVKEAAKATICSIASGEFRTESYEREVYVKLSDNVEVGGIIDRLDVCHHDGVNEYRIIDYKTGNQEFDMADIYNGIDMQPVIYALSMRMLDDKATVSGMYYSLMHNDFSNIEATSRAQTAINALKKNTAFEGVTFITEDASGEFSREELDRIESEYYRNEDSLFFKIKDGEIVRDKRIKSRADGEILMDFVRNRVLFTNKEILGGEMSISPLAKGNSSPCTYCSYKSVCRFDEKFKEERKITQKDSEVWSLLREEGE